MFVPVKDPDAIVCPVNFDDPEYPIEQAFKEAQEYARKIPKEGYVPVSDVLRLYFYAYYKQATEGDLDPSKKQPSMWRNWEGHWKYYAWSKLRGTSKEVARDEYVRLLDENIRKRSTFVWAPAKDPWKAFDEAVHLVQNFPKKPYQMPDEMRATFYGLFKQATVGDLEVFQKSAVANKEKKYKWLRSRPTKAGFDQLRYDQWASHKGMNRDQSIRAYLHYFYKIGAMHGYFWDPPGTEAHMEEVGNQLTAENRRRNGKGCSDGDDNDVSDDRTSEDSVRRREREEKERQREAEIRAMEEKEREVKKKHALLLRALGLSTDVPETPKPDTKSSGKEAEKAQGQSEKATKKESSKGKAKEEPAAAAAANSTKTTKA